MTNERQASLLARAVRATRGYIRKFGRRATPSYDAHACPTCIEHNRALYAQVTALRAALVECSTLCEWAIIVIARYDHFVLNTEKVADVQMWRQYVEHPMHAAAFEKARQVNNDVHTILQSYDGE